MKRWKDDKMTWWHGNNPCWLDCIMTWWHDDMNKHQSASVNDNIKSWLKSKRKPVYWHKCSKCKNAGYIVEHHDVANKLIMLKMEYTVLENTVLENTCLKVYLKCSLMPPYFELYKKTFKMKLE